MTALASLLSVVKGASADAEVRRRALRGVRGRLGAHRRATGLRCDSQVPHSSPQALIDIGVRPLVEKDVPILRQTEDVDLTPEEKRDRVVRRQILEAGIGTCYVAVAADHEAACMQWMFTHRDNRGVQRHRLVRRGGARALDG